MASVQLLLIFVFLAVCLAQPNYDKAGTLSVEQPLWNSTFNPLPQNSSKSLGPRVVAMTFDDGPHETLTPRLLDILKEHNAKATFFVLGRSAAMYPHIVRRIAAEGHEVASHTWSHADLLQLSMEQIWDELASTEQALKAAGVHPTVFRPPFGQSTKAIDEFIRSRFGYSVVTWSFCAFDWMRPPPDVLVQRWSAAAKPGAIFLGHDIHPNTVEAIPGLVRAMNGKGYQMVTVSELQASYGGPNGECTTCHHLY